MKDGSRQKCVNVQNVPWHDDSGDEWLSSPRGGGACGAMTMKYTRVPEAETMYLRSQSSCAHSLKTRLCDCVPSLHLSNFKKTTSRVPLSQFNECDRKQTHDFPLRLEQLRIQRRTMASDEGEGAVTLSFFTRCSPLQHTSLAHRPPRANQVVNCCTLPRSISPQL